MSKQNLLPLHENETAMLIRASMGRGSVPLAFGTGGAALIVDQAPWAVQLIAEWRGVTFQDGAGI